MPDWNLADVWDAVAETVPDRPAQVCGDRRVTWREFDRRANALAADLLRAGLGRQSKVAAYLRNGPEYLEVYAGAFKVSMVPVNVNYRYGAAELRYLLDNADAEAVVFHSSFAPTVEPIRADLPGVRRWYAVDDGAAVPAWASPYEGVVAGGAPAVPAPWDRSGDDLLLLYTGGTTGMPKGVMWRSDDLFGVLGGGGNPLLGIEPAADLADLRARLAASSAGIVQLPACPLMHGTGQFSAFIAMIGGGCIVTIPDLRFDPAVLWATVAREKVNVLSIVGDAFARPLLGELEAHPARYDLSSLLLINSSGVMWSQEVKDGILRHIPHVTLYDSLGSSEAVGMGGNVSAAGQAAGTATFQLGEGVRVLGPDDRDVAPGSGEVGVIALPGRIPVGYYKDPQKTAQTFKTVDGVRYTVPGDCATVDADGTIRLLGRGSVVINTGGEKVYPEEVEEVVKRLPEVADAVCVGIPDERFGERVCAMVELRPGAHLGEEAVRDAVRAALAGYKVPRVVQFVESIGRSPAGKVDYRALRDRASSPPAA